MSPIVRERRDTRPREAQLKKLACIVRVCAECGATSGLCLACRWSAVHRHVPRDPPRHHAAGPSIQAHRPLVAHPISRRYFLAPCRRRWVVFETGQWPEHRQRPRRRHRGPTATLRREPHGHRRNQHGQRDARRRPSPPSPRSHHPAFTDDLAPTLGADVHAPRTFIDSRRRHAIHPVPAFRTAPPPARSIPEQRPKQQCDRGDSDGRGPEPVGPSYWAAEHPLEDTDSLAPRIRARRRHPENRSYISRPDRQPVRASLWA